MAALVGHRLAGAAAARGGAAAATPAGGPTATWTRSARCSTSPPAPRRSSGLRGVTGFLAEVEGQQIPADTLRESELRGAGGPGAHRAPGQGPGVGAGRGRRRAGGRLARRAPARLAAGGRPARPPRACPSRCPTAVADRRGAPAVLRGLHPGPVAGWWSPRWPAPRARATSRPGSSTELGVPVQRAARPAAAAAVAGRAGRRAAPGQRRPGGARRRCASRRRSGWPGWPTRTDADGRPLVPAAAPGAVVGDAPAERGAAARGAAGRAGPAVRQPARRACWPARGSGSWPAGPGRVGPQHARPASARWCTCWPSTARGGTVDPGELSDHLEAVWDQLDFDANWLSAVERVEAESALERFAAWQEARTGQRAARHRGAVQLRGRPRRRAGAADRHGRPGRARPRRPDPDRRLQDLASRRRPRPTWRCRTSSGVYQLAVAAGRVRRRRRARTPGRAAPSWSTCGCPTAPSAYPRVFQQASLDDVPFPLGATRPGRADAEPTRRSRPGCTGGWPRRPRSSAPSGSTPGSARPAATARSAAAARRRPPGGRWSRDRPRAAPAAAHAPGSATPADLVEALGIAVLRPAARRDHRAARAGRDHRRRRLGQDDGDGGPGGLAGRHRRGPARGGARPDLHPQGGRRAVRTGSGRRCSRPGWSPTAGVDESGEQLIMTYDAFAARLVSEHGLRLGFEADPTMISGATRYRLASRVVKAAAGPVRVHLPAAAGHGDRAGAQARRRPAAAPGRPAPSSTRTPASC